MIDRTIRRLDSKGPGLLVSVRNAAEALAALAGGADVIDIKEPARGPLGAADTTTIADIVTAVAGRATVTAAMGELIDFTIPASGTEAISLPPGVSLFKFGLAGCDRTPSWQSHWRNAIATLNGNTAGAEPQPVAVVYADWQAAGAPPPENVLSAAVDLRCPALLIDTWDKSAGRLFELWPADELREFLHRVRVTNLVIVLAGSLGGDSFETAAQMAPDLVAVRTAACEGGRNGIVTAERVRKLKQVLAAGPSAISATSA